MYLTQCWFWGTDSSSSHTSDWASGLKWENSLGYFQLSTHFSMFCRNDVWLGSNVWLFCEEGKWASGLGWNWPLTVSWTAAPLENWIMHHHVKTTRFQLQHWFKSTSWIDLTSSRKLTIPAHENQCDPRCANVSETKSCDMHFLVGVTEQICIVNAFIRHT